MAIGVFAMYMNMDLANFLRKKYGSTAGLSLATFFEEWRNYGQEYVIKNYNQRTYYYYLNRLLDEGLIVRESYGVYKIASGYEEPIRLR